MISASARPPGWIRVARWAIYGAVGVLTLGAVLLALDWFREVLF